MKIKKEEKKEMDSKIKDQGIDAEQIERAARRLDLVRGLGLELPFPALEREFTDAELRAILSVPATLAQRAKLADQLLATDADLCAVYAVAYGPSRSEPLAQRIHKLTRELGYISGGGSE
jgi:hypothetical protein